MCRPDQQLMVTAVSAADKQQDSSIWTTTGSNDRLQRHFNEWLPSCNQYCSSQYSS